MVVQGLQHYIHGESKQASQEDVENYIEEKDKTCRQRETRELYQTICNIHQKWNFMEALRQNIQFDRPLLLLSILNSGISLRISNK